MSVLSEYLTLDAVRVNVEATSRKRLFEEAALAVESAYGVPHAEAFDALIERERLGATGVGCGCAIPHGRLNSLESPAVVFLRTKNPVDYDAPDDRPVSLVMVILVPKESQAAHLALLRETTALFSESEMREKLQAAADPIDVCRLLAPWEPPFANEAP